MPEYYIHMIYKTKGIIPTNKELLIMTITHSRVGELVLSLQSYICKYICKYI